VSVLYDLVRCGVCGTSWVDHSSALCEHGRQPRLSRDEPLPPELSQLIRLIKVNLPPGSLPDGCTWNGEARRLLGPYLGDRVSEVEGLRVTRVDAAPVRG
jgi:hypothetical protein